MLTNLTIMYAVSLQHNEDTFSLVTNLMVTWAFIQCCVIVLCHFVTYTLQWDVAITEKLIKFFAVKKSSRNSYNLTMLNIPERTYNYNEYQDGLVSDDFM